MQLTLSDGRLIQLVLYSILLFTNITLNSSELISITMIHESHVG